MKLNLKKYRAKILYQDYYKAYKSNMYMLLNYFQLSGKKVAIWGYGLKGEAFLQMFDKEKSHILCVFDSNKELYGKDTTTGHPIISYRDMDRYGIDTILVMNKVFFTDIERTLHNDGYQLQLVDIDVLIENQVQFQDYIEGNITIKNEVNYDMREIQMVELSILKEVDRICKKHNINYFLSAGTALGAIRHQGFIPWDEDIDIGMQRKDFDHFRSIIRSEISEDYYYQTMKKGMDFFYPIDQIVKNNTSYVRLELANSKTHHGLHIDVFPFDNVSTNETLREQQVKQVQKYRELLRKKLTKQIYESKNPFKMAIIHTNYYLLKLVPFHFLKYKLEHSLTKYAKQDTGYIADLCTHYKKIMYFKVEDMIPTRLAQFEDVLLPIPNNPEAYLTMMYGDYMTPPPEGKRLQKHRLEEVSCSKGYYKDDYWLAKRKR